MDVILEVQGGYSFSIEVHPFDTIRHVKEKVQNFHHIPISHQIFIFNGQLLQDDLHVWGSQINHGSRIHLIVAVDDSANLAPPPQPQPTPEPQLAPFPSCEEYELLGMPQWNPSSQLIPVPYDHDPLGMPEFSTSTQLMPMPNDYNPFGMPEFPSSTQLMPMPHDCNAFGMPEFPSSMQLMPMPSTREELEEWLPRIDMPPSRPPRVTLNVKVPTSKDRIPIEMDLDEYDTVLKLKMKIVARQEMQGVPVERIALLSHLTCVELLDHQALKDFAVSDHDEIDVFVRPSPPVAGGVPVKLKLKVLPMRSREKIEVEVNGKDKVSVLKEELKKLSRTLRFPLPEDGLYFFIHGQSVMYEEKSFLWHGVKQGDTIATFDGFVSAAPARSILRGKRR